MFGAFFYSYCPVFIITSHLLFFKAHFPVKPNASLLGKICSPAGRRITTWPCLGIPKKKYSWASHFQLEKINIWAGYLAWARRATTRPVNTCSDVFVVVQRRKINIWGKHRKTLQCSHLKNTNTARAAWSQLSAASCAILSFIDYIGWQWCGTMMSGNQEEAKKNIVLYTNKEALAYV